MTALIAAVGTKAVLWISGALTLLLGGVLWTRSAQSNGAAGQRAADAQKQETDNAATSKARSGVDGMAEPSLDGGLREFERK